MEYDTLRIDRRITQAFKRQHEAKGANALTWRAAITQLIIREAGLMGEKLPEAPAKLPPGRPKSGMASSTLSATPASEPVPADPVAPKKVWDPTSQEDIKFFKENAGWINETRVKQGKPEHDMVSFCLEMNS